MIGFSSLWRALADLLDISLLVYFGVVLAVLVVSGAQISPINPTTQSMLSFLQRAAEPTLNFFRRLLRVKPFSMLSSTILPKEIILGFLVLFTIWVSRLFLVQTFQDMTEIILPSQILRFVLSNFFLALLFTFSSTLDIYFWIVIIAVIVSWIPLDPYHPIARMILTFLRHLTEPVFEYVREKLNLHRYTAPLDVTPILVIIAIRLIQTALIGNLAALVSQLRYL